MEETLTIPVAEEYHHGYTEEQVEEIKKKFSLIEDRQDISLEQFRDIVIPHIRIHRITEFKLAKEKKVRKVKEPKEPKEPKAKKLTKKQIDAKVFEITFKIAAGKDITEEEKEFYTQYKSNEVI